MRDIIFIIVCGVLLCVALQARASQFLERSRVVEKACSENLKRTPMMQWLRLGTETGQSMTTVAAICYRDGMKTATRETGYRYAELVNRYAETLVQLSQARDAGKIGTQAALSYYRGLRADYKNFIALEDATEQQRESRRLLNGIREVATQLPT